jgi:autotransporter-associated beta strand protein
MSICHNSKHLAASSKIVWASLIVAHAAFQHQVRGSNGTWTGATVSTGSAQSLWSTTDNWTGNVVPGSAYPTPNSDTANFTVGTSSQLAITLDPGRAITNMAITQDGSSINEFTFGSSTVNATPALVLYGGGQITVGFTGGSAPVATSSPIFNCPLQLAGSTYTINDAVPAADTFLGISLKGDIYPIGTSPTTLTLTGTDGPNSSKAYAAIASGQLRDNNGVTLGVIKTGTGGWELRETAASSNTYSGPTLIEQGTLRFNGAGSLSPNTDIIVSGSGTFRGSTTGIIGHSITLVGSQAQISNSNDATTIGFTGGTTTPAVTLDYSSDSFSTSLTITAGSTLLAGTIPDAGGFTYLNDANTAQATWSKYISTGTVERLFNIAHGGQNITAGTGNPIDLVFSGNVDGSGNLVKTGNGTLEFSNGGKTLTGALIASAGTIKFSATNNVFLNAPPLESTGGTVDFGGATQTFATYTMTAGALLGSYSSTSNSYGTLVAPSYNLAVNTPNSGSISSVLADDGSPSNVVMSGSGTVSLSSPNGSLTYTGGTTVSGSGTLTLTQAQHSESGTLIVTGPGTLAFGAPAGPTSTLVAQVPTATVSGTGALSIPYTDRTANAQRIAYFNSLSLGTSGHFDITDNDLILHGTSLTAATALVASGVHGGPGILSSTAGGSGRDALATVAVIQNSDGQGGALYATFDGVAVTSTDILIKYTYIGDTNLDGVVDATDLANVLAGINGHLTGWINGDFTYAGSVTSADLSLLLTSLAGQGAPFSDGGGGASGTVPEPSSLAVLAIPALAVARRRRA